MKVLSPLESLALRVKSARQSLKLSQEQAAINAQVGIASLRRVEQNQQVRPSTLRAIARALDIPPEELIRLANGETPAPATRWEKWEENTISSPPSPETGHRPQPPQTRKNTGTTTTDLLLLPTGETPRPLQSVIEAAPLASGIEGDLAEVESGQLKWEPLAPEKEDVATIALEPELQRLYTCLSANFNLVPLEAVAQICGEPQAAEYIVRLRERGLVGVETVHGEACVRVLAGREAEIRARRHAEYFCRKALEVTAQRFRPNTLSNEEQLRAFYPDLHRALMWYLAHGDAETTLRFVIAMTEAPIEGSTVLEMQQWLARALARPGAEKPTVWRARALMVQAGLSDFAMAEKLHKEALKLYKRLGEEREAANVVRRMAVQKRMEGNFGAARKLFEESRALQEKCGNKLGVAAVYNSFANLEVQEQNYSAALDLYERARAIYEAEGDGDHLAGVLENLGNMAFQAQHYAKARGYYEESFKIRDKLGLTRNFADSLYNLGDVAMHQGDYKEAEHCFRKALERCRDFGGGNVAEFLEGYAALKLKQEQPVHAARIFGAAMKLREAVHNPPPPSERLGYPLDINAARAALDKNVFEAEWQAGREMSLQEALQYALNTPIFQETWHSQQE